MKLVRITMELGIDDEDSLLNDKESIAAYLNEKLHMDPEFFGDFAEENIVEVRELE